MFFTSIKQINRLRKEINRLSSKEINRLRKKINRLLSKGMSNIYLKVTTKNLCSQNFDFPNLERQTLFQLFQNIHTFIYQKILLHTLFCLFLKSSKAFSVSLIGFYLNIRLYSEKHTLKKLYSPFYEWG